MPARIHRLVWAGQVAIPDNFAPGLQVFSTIAATPSERITQVDIRVYATHSYSGDISLMLVAPNGHETIFHKADMGSKTVIQRTWSLDDFNGQDPSGEWSLVVIDTLPRNQGRLLRWEMDVHTHASLEAQAHVDVTSVPTRTIVEFNPRSLRPPGPFSITSHIPIIATGSLTNLEVLTTFTHPYPEDLELTLASAQSHHIPLNAALGSRHNNISRRYIPSPDALANALGSQVQGDWMLHINDSRTGQHGTFDGWCLKLDITCPLIFTYRSTLSWSPHGHSTPLSAGHP